MFAVSGGINAALRKPKTQSLASNFPFGDFTFGKKKNMIVSNAFLIVYFYINISIN